MANENDIRVWVDYKQTRDMVNGVTYIAPEGMGIDQVVQFLDNLCLDRWESTSEPDPQRINITIVNGWHDRGKLYLPPEDWTVHDVMDLMDRCGWQQFSTNQDLEPRDGYGQA